MQQHNSDPKVQPSGNQGWSGGVQRLDGADNSKSDDQWERPTPDFEGPSTTIDYV